MQERVNLLDESKPVAVLYFYRVAPRTKTDQELMAYREFYGWRL